MSPPKIPVPQPKASRTLGVFLQRAFFSLLVLLGVLGGAEGVSRLIWSETDLVMNPVLWGFRDHPTLLWMYRPSSDITCEGCPEMRTNSWGLRGPDFTAEKPPQTLRILSLGESTTFGAFVAEEETYTATLEDKLNNRLLDAPIEGIQSVEAINAAVEAWSVWQSRVWLEEVGLSLKPDIILVYHQLNDTLPTGVRDRANFLYQVRDTDRQQLMRRKRFSAVFSVLLRSRAYLALRKSVLRLPSSLPTPQQQGHATTGERVPREDRLAALEDMHQLSTAINAQLVIIRPHYAAAPQLLRDTVLMDFAAQHDLPLVDIPAHIRRHRSRGVRLYSDGVHPTAQGHALYAEAIVQTLEARGVLLQVTP